MEASIKSYLCHDEKGQSIESSLSKKSKKQWEYFWYSFQMVLKMWKQAVELKHVK
jgi:hypothetical protein